MPGKRRMIRNEGVPSLPSLFLSFTKLDITRENTDMLWIVYKQGVIAGNHKRYDSGRWFALIWKLAFIHTSTTLC